MKQFNYRYVVPETKRLRMLVLTDAKNEADDQFAIAHHLMTPKFEVKGIMGCHFDHFYKRGTTAKESVDEILKVMELMELSGVCPVAEGAPHAMPDEHTPIDSPAARMIIEEALREDPLPLYIACQGALTDLASAILLEPCICDKMTALWIGGGAYPEGEWEFNVQQDICAANVLLSSEMAVWQIPMNVYKQMNVSLAQLQLRVAPCGRIGKYLFEQMVEYNIKTADIAHWPHGEIWGLGDSPTIGVLMIEGERKDVYDIIPAPRIDYETFRYVYDRPARKIRVYKTANAYLTLEDFFAKLAINYGNASYPE